MALTNPGLSTNNKLFSYTLPQGWSADFCGWDVSSTNAQVYGKSPVTGPYCGYNQDSRMWLGASAYNYDYTGFYSSSQGATSTNATSAQKATANNAMLKKQMLADIAVHDKQIKARGTGGGTTNPKKDDQVTVTAVTIDGLQMTRTQIIYGSSYARWISPGTKEIYYDYFQDIPTSDTTGTYKWFSADYWQDPKTTDYSAGFDQMIQTLNLKW